MVGAVTPQRFQTGFALQDGDFLNRTISDSFGRAEQSITAIGTTQATAYQLTGNMNNITTAASGTGVNLGVAASRSGQVGEWAFIANNGANPVTVYAPQGTSDTIDGVAGATGVTLTNAFTCFFYCVAAGVWISGGRGAKSS